MKKVILSATLMAVTSISFAQFIPGTVSSNDTYFNEAHVGIGLSDPTAKLDISLNTDFMYKDESGLRLTYPIPELKSDGGPKSASANQSMFHIRQRTLHSSFSSRFVVKTNGNVGIGVDVNDILLKNQRLVVTDNDAKKIDLHVMGFSLIDGKNASLLLGSETGAAFGEWGIEYNDYGPISGMNFWKPNGSNGFGNYFMFLSDQGNVSIGTNNSEGYKFAVNGDMIAEKVVVKLNADWPDFVFTKKYDLMPLEDVELFIKENSHLPNVPSAQEVKTGGIDLGAMDATLLQKVEELTLYVIELKKEIEGLKK